MMNKNVYIYIITENNQLGSEPRHMGRLCSGFRVNATFKIL